VLQVKGSLDGAAIRPGLRALQVDAAAELESWKGQYRVEAEEVFEKLGVGGSATMDRNIMSALWDAVPPGIDELFALSEIVDAAETDETIVVDSAPTGHFLRLIESPDLALDWTHAILRILLKYGVAGALDGFSERMLAFARQLKQLNAMLTNPAESGVLVVTMQEPVVEAQTERLIDALRAANVAIAARIVNRAHHAAHRTGITTLITPDAAEPPTGTAGLEAFYGQWELA
jgi:arsenite/tail-anchored protein-transporting ATPase